MSLPENVNEDLAGLRGWKPCANSAIGWERQRGHVDNGGYTVYMPGCPDMTTPDAADELVEFCRVRGFYVDVLPTGNGYEVEVLRDEEKHDGWLKHLPGTQAIQETRGEAVALAVHAARKFLTEKEPTDD